MTTLYRAADDGIITDCASFSASREVAEAYLDNPGFGGRSLWSADVDLESASVLDLYDDADPVQTIVDLLDVRHPGAIGADEWVPRICSRLADAGYEWVRVRDSYPVDAETWIWVGGDEPEMTEENS